MFQNIFDQCINTVNQLFSSTDVNESNFTSSRNRSIEQEFDKTALYKVNSVNGWTKLM